MKIEEQAYGAVTLMKPVGPITEADVEDLYTRLVDVRTRNLGRLVIDITAVPFIDSQGLECLLELADEMGKTGQVLKLCGENDTFREILELTDLSAVFEQFPDANTAVRSFI